VPARERISDADPCDLAETWGVDADVMRRVWLSAVDWERQTGSLRRVQIISGFRTAQEQERLRRQGRPTASDSRSTHRSCPATGVDVNLGFAPSRLEIVLWGNVVLVNGLRWGGGGKVNEVGVPLDWQHVDRGPRRNA